MIIVDPGKAPSWIAFMKRVRWNYAVERYRSWWFHALTDEDIDKIFDIFIESYRGVSKNHPSSTVNFVFRTKIEPGLNQIKSLVKDAHNLVSLKDSRVLYDMFNGSFFAVFNKYKNAGDTDQIVIYELKHWMDEVSTKLKRALPEENKGLNVQLSLNGHSSVKSVQVADFLAVAQSSQLPSDVSKLTLGVHEKAERMQTWSVDSSSQHSIAKISSEYLPNIVTSFVNVLNSGDSKSVEKVHKSVIKQLTVLSDYLNNVEKSNVQNSVYEMSVQERFITDKFTSGGSLQR